MLDWDVPWEAAVLQTVFFKKLSGVLKGRQVFFRESEMSLPCKAICMQCNKIRKCKKCSLAKLGAVGQNVRRGRHEPDHSYFVLRILDFIQAVRSL